MGRYQGLTAAFVERLDAATDKLRGDDDFVAVDMTWLEDLSAMLEAKRCGRPYSRRPRTEFDDARDAERQRGELCNLEDPTDPGARMLRDMKQLRQRMAEDPETATLHEQMEQAKKDTIAAIQREQRERDHRERQRTKRARRAEKKRHAAVQEAEPARTDLFSDRAY